jgi:signal transduction histidine kinase
MTPAAPALRRGTIKQKLTWLSAIGISTAVLLASSAFIGYHFVSFRRAIVRTLLVQADTLALNSVSALRFHDERSARDTLAALRADPNVLVAAVYSSDGRLFAQYGEHAEPVAPPLDSRGRDTVRFDGRILRVAHAINADGERLGILALAYSLDDLFADLLRYAIIGVIVLAVSTVIALVLVSRMQRGFSEPISRLAAAADAISRNQDYAVRVTGPKSHDELGQLIDTFNDMLAQIQLHDIEVEAARAKVLRLSEELEQRVVQRTAQLESTNRELEAFTYSVSHDLRAPLRRIDGFANLLIEQESAHLSTEGMHFLQRMREGTRHMGHLVDDLLNLGRVSRQELRLQVAGLSPIVAGALEAVKRDATGRNIDWRIEPLPFVECDPGLMEVVFTNLLSNAVKYTRPRAEAIIEVGSVERDGRRAIFVRDNGVGFSMRYADKLFGVFQRLHRAEDFEGTGVGLATVQRIVNKHGGTIWAEAELDKGACFYFTLGTSAVTPAGVVQETLP